MSISRGVIVDDRSVQVLSYSGGWSQDTLVGDYQEYNTTTSGPLAQGAHLSFSFNGTSVSVYGTLIGVSPTIEYTVDNNTPTISQSPSTRGTTYHNQFYTMNNLVDGPHTLQITVTQQNTTSDSNWFFDYIIYTPSADPSMSSLRSGESFFFDDADSTFQYSGPWSTGDGTGSDMQGTLHTALSLNSSVSLRFTGTYVDVFVRLPMSTSISAIAQVVIDGGDPFIANYPPVSDIIFDSSTSTSSNYRLYHNPFLSSASHVMVITPTTEPALWLDYVIAGTGLDMSNPQDSPSFPFSTSATPSPTQLPNPSKSSLHSYATVVGVTAVGAILLTLFAVWMFVFIRRKRKHRQVGGNSGVLVNPNVNEMVTLAPGGHRTTLVTPYSVIYGNTAATALAEVPENTDRFRDWEKSRVQTGTIAPLVENAVVLPIAESSSSQAPLPPANSRRHGSTSDSRISEDLPPFYSPD